MKHLNIYYSGGCDSNCAYCIMRDTPHINNTEIQVALEDGTFAHYVRQALTQDTISLGFWGMEPAINGKYFSTFIISILDYSPYIRYIMIPTNGQSNTFYQDFIIPVLTYCSIHHRKLIMQLQFSLDGPPDLHDKYRGTGSYQCCMDNLYYIANTFPYDNRYLKLRVGTKSTIRGEDLENYPVNQWLDFMYAKEVEFIELHSRRWGASKDYININPIITVEVPGNYTAAQGHALRPWVRQRMDESFIKTDGTYCRAGEDSKAIDCYGNIYDCQLLINKNFDLAHLREDFEEKMDHLVINGEAIEQDRNKLFNAIMSIYCWAIANNDIPESYIKLLGNGVLL